MSRRKNGIRKARIQKLNEINKIDKRIKSKGYEDRDWETKPPPLL